MRNVRVDFGCCHGIQDEMRQFSVWKLILTTLIIHFDTSESRLGRTATNHASTICQPKREFVIYWVIQVKKKRFSTLRIGSWLNIRLKIPTLELPIHWHEIAEVFISTFSWQFIHRFDSVKNDAHLNYSKCIRLWSILACFQHPHDGKQSEADSLEIWLICPNNNYTRKRN